jgi:hypothetical protein
MCILSSLSLFFFLLHSSYTLRCRGFAESPPCSPVFRQLLVFFPRDVHFTLIKIISFLFTFYLKVLNLKSYEIALTYILVSRNLGRAIAQAVSRWVPIAAARVDLWWTKWRWGRFSPSTSVSTANLHSTKFSIIIITRGRYSMPFSGRRAEWTQFGLHPPLCELKKKRSKFCKSGGGGCCVTYAATT